MTTSPSAVSAYRLPCARPASEICRTYCVTRGPASLHRGTVERAVRHDLPLAALRLPQQLATTAFVPLRRIVDLAGDRVEIAQCLELRDKGVARDRSLDFFETRVRDLAGEPAPRGIDIRRMTGRVLAHRVGELHPLRIGTARRRQERRAIRPLERCDRAEDAAVTAGGRCQDARWMVVEARHLVEYLRTRRRDRREHHDLDARGLQFDDGAAEIHLRGHVRD